MNTGSKNYHNILVTGLCRSGTTWLGKILGYNIQYINEPFSLAIEKNRKVVKRDYEYIYYGSSIQRKQEFENHIESLIKKDRFLLKSPFSLFSSKWFKETFNIEPLVSMRNPLSFVSSYIFHKWDQRMNCFLEQNNLIKEIKPFKEEIETIIPGDIINQAIILWNIGSYFTTKHNLRIIKNEDLSLNPIYYFKKLYEEFNLDFNNDVINEIMATTTYGGKYFIWGTKRNSIENINIF